MQRKHALGIVLGLGSVCALSACLLFRWDAVSPAISKAAEGIWSSRAEALADPIDDETETAARPTTPAPANPVRCPDVLQCDENPLIDAIRQVLRSKLDLVAWKGKWRLAQRADESQYGHPFGSFLSAFAGDERFEWQYEWPQLCPTMKAKRTSGYVVLTSFNENWGFTSTFVVNRTKAWRTGCPFGPHKGTFGEQLDRAGCTEAGVRAWLDSPTLKGVVTCQHQCFAHPKIISIPLGVTTSLTRTILGWLSTSREEACNSTGLRWLLVNFSPIAHRKQITETILRNFPDLDNSWKSSVDGGGMVAYFRMLRCSRFVICPSGVGWDTYRLWESLSLGAIPIVENSPGWIRVLDELPVLIVENFAEVTQELLEREYPRIMNNLQAYNFRRLTRQWWIERVRSLLPRSSAATGAPAPSEDTSKCGPRFKEESEGCMQGWNQKPDCCVIDGEGECSDGFEGYHSDDLCWHNGGSAGGSPESWLSRATLFAYRMCCAAKAPAASGNGTVAAVPAVVTPVPTIHDAPKQDKVTWPPSSRAVETAVADDRSKPMPGGKLVDQVRLLKSELGLTGTLKEVVQQAAKELGVPSEGKPLAAIAALCASACRIVRLLKSELGLSGSAKEVIQQAAKELGVPSEGKPLAAVAALCASTLGL